MPSKARFNFLWITDPWETLDHAGDTTLRLAEEALSLGIDSYWCNFRTIQWKEKTTIVDACAIESITSDRTSKDFKLSAPIQTPAHQFNSIQYRADPPVDQGYWYPLQLLMFGVEKAELIGSIKRGSSEIVNPPKVLLGSNEKLEQALIGDLLPPSIVASGWNSLAEFGLAEKLTVLKPLNDVQSHGIELLDWRTKDGIEHAHYELEKATNSFTRLVLLQRYLDGVSDGEIRLWFIDGSLLAFARKRSVTGHFRINMDAGDMLMTTNLNSQEQQAADLISQRLRMQGIRLAAVDMIDAQVTDFNHLSPGLLPQIERVVGRNLARSIIQKLAGWM
jgi:glutathione synthase